MTIPYDPSIRITNVQGLYSNHFRFTLESLPDLTFFAQTASLPSISGASLDRATPFTKIKEVGDQLQYGSFNVTYLVDAAFKTYNSIYWWMKGYGFPHDHAEVQAFREARTQQLPIGRPRVRELEKTGATLHILQPDTEKILVEARYSDVFPIGLSELSFATTDGEPGILTATATFVCTEFDIYPVE